jgi:hypothetical protein
MQRLRKEIERLSGLIVPHIQGEEAREKRWPQRSFIKWVIAKSKGSWL